MTRRHFKFIPAVAAGFMAIALSACGGSSSGGAGSSIEPLFAPTINNQPAAQSVTEGQTATFSVTAAGTAPLIYQWQKNSTDISGATLSTYTTPATAIGDNGAQYSVVVFNGAGTATSDKATLTVSAASGGLGAPVIGTQPTNQSVAVGQTAKFSVTATGTGTLTYQWQKNGTDISGATSSTYTTPATSSTDNGALYSVVVFNGAGTVTSNQATLTVSAATGAPAIGTQPANQSVVAGQTASFSVTATGNGPLTYQWKKNGTDIEGVTTSSHTTDATVLADSGAVFTVVVTNSAGSVTSSGAALTVNAAPPAITAQPTAQTITAGQTATFSVTATGTGTLSYQWKKNGTNITGGMGATTSIYTTPAMGFAGNGAVYSVVVTDSVGATTSSTATLTVTKVSALQSYGYVANASDDLYDKTECVQDNNTGLIWEGKTVSPATSRLGTGTYTNYDGANSAQKPSGGTYVNPTQTEIDASTNSIGYKNSVNTSALCGYTDWRLPTKDELFGIVASSGSPRIDTTWFPNTQASYYWSSSPSVGYSYYAWYVYFDTGVPGSFGRYFSSYVRLVRCSNGAATCP